ncbi:MAG: shikimate dehydrogenase [Pseudomonadota bacterium]
MTIDQYAVIGHPISHSKSPLIHTLFAEQTRQNMQYRAIEAPLDGFADTIARLRAEGYQGCNITVPFKFEAFQLATERSERAQLAEAVNTLKFDGNTAYGDNTDGAGLVRDITHNLGFDLRGKRVLLMGAGGAAYGVALPLLQAGAHLTIANRTADKAIKLADACAPFGSTQGCGYEGLAGQTFDCVINATSTGLTGDLPPLPSGLFAPGALAYDMMYGKETPFMRFAKEHGAAQIADGLGMLVEQAAEAFFVWRGVRPETGHVLEQLRAL